MTIVPAKQLSNQEMDTLGNNVRPAVKLDQRLEALNRSLAVHGEELDDNDIELAYQSEEVAS